jgi:hypothetical protein
LNKTAIVSDLAGKKSYLKNGLRSRSMKKAGFPIFAIVVSIFLTSFIGIAEAKKVVKVQIHTTVGGPITEAQIREWINVANSIDGPNIVYVVDSNHVHPPGTTPKDPNVNDKGRFNIWGLPRCVVTGEPNYVSGAEPGSGIIELVPGFVSAGPNDPNVKIKPSTLAHELNELQGLPHSDDPNNKMHPDNSTHGGTEPRHSCHRTGTNLTPEQRKILDDSNLPYIQYAVLSGAGNEVYDISGDVIDPNIDLFWAQGWLEWVSGQHIIHLTAEVDVVSFFDVWPEIGFYINSDGYQATGEPPEGLDCYLAYNPHFNEMIFQRYDNLGGGWVNEAPPEGVSCELSYTSKDSDDPPTPSGVRFTGPLNVLLPGPMLTGNFAFKATARRPDERDFAPDVGLLTITYPPYPIPGDLNLDNKVDTADLEIMTWDWPETGTSRADIFPPFGDGLVDFIDYAVLANNWLIEVP